MEPKDPKMEPQGSQSTQKTNNSIPRAPAWSPRCYNGVLRSPKVQQNTQKGPTKCYSGPKLCCEVTKKKAHIDTNSQPTKETKRDTKKQTTKQTHKQTNKRTNTQTNTLTKTPLASHCKHKHKLPRPGARRRRRRSAAVLAPPAGVLGGLLSKNLD